MIEALKALIVTYLETAAVTGEDLEGCTVFDIDTVPDAAKHPAITVDWMEKLNATRQRSARGPVKLEWDVLVTLYVSSTKGLRSAHVRLNNLVVRPGATRYMGLHVMLSNLADATITDSLGTDWGVELDPENNRGVVSAGNGQFASVAIAFKLNCWTMVDRALYSHS